MSNKILISVLTLSLIANGVMGYYLNLANFDLKNAQEASQHYYNELIKEKQYREMDKVVNFDSSTAIPEGFEIEKAQPKKISHRNLPNIYIPPRQSEPYIPIQTSSPQPVYYANERAIQPQTTNNTDIYRASKALENIDVNMTLDSMFPKSNIVYPYPRY